MNDIGTFLNGWTAAEQRGDATALDTYLTDDFLGIGPLGFTLPKPAWLARHRSGDLTYETFDLDEVQTRVYCDVAVVTARQSGKGAYQGRPIPEAVRSTLVVVRDGGRWRLASNHMSFVAGTAGAPPLPGGAPTGTPQR
jgi:ketosteroid isomerase-like protein